MAKHFYLVLFTLITIFYLEPRCDAKNAFQKEHLNTRLANEIRKNYFPREKYTPKAVYTVSTDGNCKVIKCKLAQSSGDKINDRAGWHAIRLASLSSIKEARLTSFKVTFDTYSVVVQILN